MPCDRHEEIIDTIDDHEDRIKFLELNDVEVRTELKNLISTVKELINWIKYFFTALLLGGGGFIVWYIQNYPTK